MIKVENKKIVRYECKCCKCGRVFNASKSIYQELGELSNGCGSCPHCDAFLNLTFDEEKEVMYSKLWDDYLEEKGLNRVPSV